MSSFKLNLLNGVLNTIASFHPEYRVAIGTIIHNEPLIEKLGPVVAAGIKEGPGAVTAIQASAPELIKAIRSLVATGTRLAGRPGDPLPSPLPGPTQRAVDVHVENVTRSLFGLSGMSVEEQNAWMQSKSPYGQNDSTQGSG